MKSTRMKLGDVTLHDCGGNRLSSRSVSWNSTGSWLAIASSGDRMAKVWTIEESAMSVGGREVLAISGHGAPVQKVRFHPTEESIICTTAFDSTVRIWDVRDASQRPLGRIELRNSSSSSSQGGGPAPGVSNGGRDVDGRGDGKDAAVSVEWAPGNQSAGSSSLYLAVAERDGSVHIFDARRMHAGARGGARSHSHSTSIPIHSFKMPKKVIMDACVFSPNTQHLIAATSSKREGTGELRIWNWKEPNAEHFVCPAHTGPIYSLAFSPDGTKLATGGFDAIVGLWDVDSMCCTSSITRRTNFIRSVAFSHDSKLLATCSAEDGIDLADATCNGELVGTIPLSNKRQSAPTGGADEIAFNPRSYILACARLPSPRGDSPMIQQQMPAVTIAKMTIS